MDPNEALRKGRIAAEEILAGTEAAITVAEYATDLATAFQALDVSISRGGALPTDWTWGQHPDTEQIVERAVQRYIEAKGGSPMTMAEKRAWDKSRRLQIPAIFDPSNDSDDDRGSD